jgi:ATP-binding cassette subfamily F protein 3
MRVLAGGEFQGGERVVGHNVVLDYFAQDQAETMAGSRTAYDELLADAPFAMVPQLRDILGAFLFTGDDIRKTVSVLSGGERNRLALAKMLLRPSNLLLMDEPTNHLDLFSKDVLLEALRAFTGTVVFVSHDRHFIDGLATRVIEVEEGGLTSYHGDYEYYLEKKSGAEEKPGLGPSSAGGLRPAGGTRTQTTGLKDSGLRAEGRFSPQAGLVSSRAHAEETSPTLTFELPKTERLKSREEEKQRQREERQRQKKLGELEREIEVAERQLAELEQAMADPAFFVDHEKARLAGEEHALLTGRIAGLYGQWEELH